MPNAKDQRDKAKPRILALSQPGGGKTSQIPTFPGKKFAYLFDPNAINSLAGSDVDYEEFLPDRLSLKLTSLSKDKQQKAREKPNPNVGAELYSAWENDFDKKREEGFFDSYDTICIDSFTTLADMVMDGVLAINGRGGQWPQQDDYGPQMLALTNIMRTLTSLDKIIYVTGHVEMKQDDLTKRIFMTPLMTGRLRTKLPILFSDLITLYAEADSKGNVNYIAQTKPDRLNPIIRVAKKGLDFKADVSLDFSKELEGQGLGGLLL